MLKTNHQLGLIDLIKRSRPINLITGPIIYSMIFPLLILDAFVSFYQWSCFPIYGIPKLSRKDFIIFDRQELKYLDWISKFHCTYCAYGVGIVAFVGAVIGETEAYFCPIKHHANKPHGPVRKYSFMAYEQADDFDFDVRLNGMREAMMKQRNL
jgi:hypothetical protein